MIDKPEIDETASQLAMEEKQRKSGGRFALFVSLLALFFTAAGIASGYKHWQRMNDKAVANQAAIDDLRQQLQQTANLAAVDKLRVDVENKTALAGQTNDKALQEMARLQNQTRQFADTVASQVEQVTLLQARMQQSVVPASAEEWQVAEVAFLLQLANRELHLEQNPKTAVAALKEADALLAKVGSVNYLPVRQQITRDLTVLEGYAPADITGVSQRITAMMLSLKPLPMVDGGMDEQAVKAATKPGTETSNDSAWATYKRKALDVMSDAVVIRQYDKPIKAALDADARVQLFQLLHLRLENLRLLALQQMDVEYQAQLQLIRDTVTAYYPEAQAKPLLDQLVELAKVKLQNAPPDISASLRQLESARHAEAQAQAAQPVPPPATDAAVTNAPAAATTSPDSANKTVVPDEKPTETKAKDGKEKAKTDSKTDTHDPAAKKDKAASKEGKGE
ncbi:MAG: hypothetical protein RI964_1179 [Pseudomonadota bacterium]|jgi:uncharacterized protein HemX